MLVYSILTAYSVEVAFAWTWLINSTLTLLSGPMGRDLTTVDADVQITRLNTPLFSLSPPNPWDGCDQVLSPSKLTLPMLRLLSPKAQKCKDL